MDSKHILVKEYLENHSLVESNLVSFNNFTEKRLQEIVTELSDGIPQEDFEIKLGTKINATNRVNIIGK